MHQGDGNLFDFAAADVYSSHIWRTHTHASRAHTHEGVARMVARHTYDMRSHVIRPMALARPSVKKMRSGTYLPFAQYIMSQLSSFRLISLFGRS